MRRRIAVVPLYISPESRELRRLAEGLEEVLQVPVDIVPPWFDPARARDRRRSQHNSTLLLAALLKRPPTDAQWILGVTYVDLFIPILTYVFGEAQLAGRASVVSSHRLDPTSYGLPANEELLMERVEKEALHELGHNFGLRHCSNTTCVMRASTYVEDIDIKSRLYCPSCQRKVLEVVHPSRW